MTIKLSSKGQIVLPVLLRRKLDLQAGDDLEIGTNSENGDLQIVLKKKQPKRLKMKIVRDSGTGLPVLKGPPGAPKLTSEMVRQMLSDFP